MKRVACLVAAVAALALAAPATADEALEHAQSLFNVGAQAYSIGDFLAAIDAFEEAYRASPRAGIQFSIAQAHRKQYYVGREASHLRAAIQSYRTYVEKVASGAHRADAAQALVELEPLAARLGDDGGSAPSKAARTRVMVSSAIDGARVSLDDGPDRPSPLVEEVKPGKHRVRVVADGYFPGELPVVAVEGGLVALDVPLHERPGQLVVRAEDGADVSVDRRLMGRTPLSGPLELSPGRHFVAVTRNGRRPFAEEITLGRASSRTLDVELQVTGQRVVSYVLLATAAAGAVAGGVFTGLAFDQQSAAEGVLATAAKRNIPQSRLDAYGAELAAREEWKRAAAATFGGALVVGVGGSALFLFDTPRALTPTRDDDGPKRTIPTLVPAPMEISFAPIVEPGALGARVAGRF